MTGGRWGLPVRNQRFVGDANPSSKLLAHAFNDMVFSSACLARGAALACTLFAS